MRAPLSLFPEKFLNPEREQKEMSHWSISVSNQVKRQIQIDQSFLQINK